MERGRVYRLEYKDSLADPVWLHRPLVPGTGREQILTDPESVGRPGRFYRVRAW